MTTQTKVLIAGGAVLALIIAAGVGAAVAVASLRPSAVAPVAPAVSDAPEPTASETPSEPGDGESAPDADVIAFVADSTRDLDDFEKDLDDMVKTVDEGGFFRLLSNSVELRFNLSQLDRHTPPDSVEPDWSYGLVDLEGSIDDIDQAVSDDDEAAIRAAIEASRAQVNTLRTIVAEVA